MKSALEPFEDDELAALARLDLQQGRIEEALRKLKALMARTSPPSVSFALAARVYRQLELPERARDCYRAYLKQNPDALQETFELGLTHFEAGEGSAADEQWRRVLDREPAHPPALFYRSLLAARESQVAEARQRLDVLFKQVLPDNLYVTRGQELLQELNSRQGDH
jgi:tetratricopeptide (TPR) repeat protein